MAKQTDLFLTKNVRIQAVQLTEDVFTTVFTAGADDSRITSIAITSNHSSIVDIILYLSNSNVDYAIGAFSIPAYAGTIATVNALTGLNTTKMPFLEIDNAGKPYLSLAAQWSIKAQLAGFTDDPVNVIIFGEDF